MRTVITALAALLLYLNATPTSAETRSDIYNGGTCTPYPAFNSSNAATYTHFLYGFRQSAFCHIVIPDDWQVEDISYVLYHALTNAGAGPLRVRLCVYSAYGLSHTCGTESTISDGYGTNWVALPGNMPSSPMGAFLSVRFPTDRVSAFSYYIPVFYR